MKLIISSTDTSPSRSVSANRRIFAGIPRLDKILWNDSGRTGSSIQMRYAIASKSSTMSVLSSVESSWSSLWFLKEKSYACYNLRFFKIISTVGKSYYFNIIGAGSYNK